MMLHDNLARDEWDFSDPFQSFVDIIQCIGWSEFDGHLHEG